MADLARNLYDLKTRMEQGLTTSESTPTSSDLPESNAPVCFKCAGAGGHTRSYTPFGTAVWKEYCDCEEGERQQAEHEAAWEAYLDNQSRKRWEYLLTQAHLPKRFMSFKFVNYPEDGDREAWQACQDYAKRIVEDSELERCSLLLVGEYGRGKTSLAVSILKEWIKGLEQNCLFIEGQNFLSQLHQSFAKNSEINTAELMEGAKKAPLLVIDDLGDKELQAPLPEWVRRELYLLINHRHGELLPTVITSNCTLDLLTIQLSERTMQRLGEMSEVIVVKGRNLRERS